MADFRRIPAGALIEALVNMAASPTPKDAAAEERWRSKYHQIEDELVQRNRPPKEEENHDEENAVT